VLLLPSFINLYFFGIKEQSIMYVDEDCSAKNNASLMTLAPEGRGQATNLHAKHAKMKMDYKFAQVPCHVIRDKIFCDKRYG